MDIRSERTEPSDSSGTWVTLRQAAEQAEVSVSKVRGLYRAGKIRSRKPAESARQEAPERRLIMVVLEDVLAQVGGAGRAPGTPDQPPSNDAPAPPTPTPIDRDEWSPITAQLEELRRTHGEVAAARERAARAGEERDALRATLGEMLRRIERLERRYATDDPTRPSAGHGNSADGAMVPDPDVEVEWHVEEPEEPEEPSLFSFLRRLEPKEPPRFSFLRRRDHRP